MKKFNPFLEIKKYLLAPETVYSKCDNRESQFGKRITIPSAALDAKYRKQIEEVGELNRALKHMVSLLDGHVYVNVWLRSVLPKHERLATYRLDLMTAYQHRWLDHLAQQFENGEILNEDR